MKSLNSGRKTRRNWVRYKKTESTDYGNTVETRPMENGQGRREMLTPLGKGVSPGMAQGNAFVYKETMARVETVEKAATRDGIEVAIMANVRSREDVELAMKCGADGIGLFRTEPYFLSTKHLPSSKAFATFLLESLEPAQGRSIDVRLLNIGADKNPIYLHLPPEPDSFFGRRGERVMREYPDLLETQLRAVLEVSREFEVGVLIPTVTVESDVTHVVSRLQKIATEMGIHKLPRIGAMIESPAAALSITSLVKHLDFFSIGTNDFTQYTMAAGRENPLVTEYFMDDHPEILRLIERVVRDAGNTPVSICGELAGRIKVIPKLLKTGIKSLSVAAALVPDVKLAVRQINVEDSENQSEIAK